MTTYRFTAERSHQWWAIISPDVTGAATQARRLDQAEPMAREVISLLLEVPEDDIDIDLEVILDDDGQAALAMASPHTSTHGWRRPRWYGRGAARGRRRVSDMWDLDGWAEVSCHERDGMQDDMLRPISSLTDPEGEFGSPIIFTEWGFNDDHPVIRDYRVPGEGCTHYVNEAPR